MNSLNNENKKTDEISSAEKVENYLKQRKSFSFTKLTDDADNMLLKGMMIDIAPESGHGGIEYRHDGEEFLYVMDGRIEIEIGEAHHSLSAGQCVRFDSSIPHKLFNPGRSTARTLVVLYVPPVK